MKRDPREYFSRGQIFTTFEPDDPAPVYLVHALGDAGARVCGMAIDYGHWDATLAGCVALVAERPGLDREHAQRLLAGNTLDFYGARLARRIEAAALARTA